MARFEEIRRKFHRAGVELFGYVVTFSDDFTDREIERAFQFDHFVEVTLPHHDVQVFRFELSDSVLGRHAAAEHYRLSDTASIDVAGLFGFLRGCR